MSLPTQQFVSILKIPSNNSTGSTTEAKLRSLAEFRVFADKPAPIPLSMLKALIALTSFHSLIASLERTNQPVIGKRLA